MHWGVHGCIGFSTCAKGFCGCTGFGTWAGGFGISIGGIGGGGGGSSICDGGSGAGGSCGLGRAGSDTWFGGTITTSGSNGGFCC